MPGQPPNDRLQVSIQAWLSRQGFPQSGSWWRRLLLIHALRSDKRCLNSSPDLLVIEIPAERPATSKAVQVPRLLPSSFGVPGSSSGLTTHMGEEEAKQRGHQPGHHRVLMLTWEHGRRGAWWGAGTVLQRAPCSTKLWFSAPQPHVPDHGQTPDQADTCRASRQAPRLATAQNGAGKP